MRPLLMSRCLPFLDRLYRVDKHQDVQGQVISDPKSQHDLRQYKKRESASKPETVGHDEPECADEDVAKRVYYRVAVVAKRGRLFAVSPNDELRVLEYFPHRLDRNCKPQLPHGRHPRSHKREQSTQQEAVEHVRKAVRIQQVLGVVRTPGIPSPQEQVVARTPPQASLAAEY